VVHYSWRSHGAADRETEMKAIDMARRLEADGYLTPLVAMVIASKANRVGLISALYRKHYA